MRLAKIITLVVPIFAVSIQLSTAANFDGSKPFVCALLDLTSCAAGGDCEKETPQSANAPRFLFVDAAKNTISGIRPDGQALSTTIQRQQTLGDLLVLEGAEGALSWTVSVNQSTGEMSLGAVGDKLGFLGFGECARNSQN